LRRSLEEYDDSGVFFVVQQREGSPTTCVVIERRVVVRS